MTAAIEGLVPGPARPVQARPVQARTVQARTVQTHRIFIRLARRLRGLGVAGILVLVIRHWWGRLRFLYHCTGRATPGSLAPLTVLSIG